MVTKRQLKHILRIRIGEFFINKSVSLKKASQKSFVGKYRLFLFRIILHLFDFSLFDVLDTLHYQKTNGGFERTLLANKRKGVVGNVVFADDIVGNEMKEKDLPDVYLNRYENVIIQGNSDVVVDLGKKVVVNNYCYGIDPAIEFIDGLLYRTQDNVALLRSNFREIFGSIESGIMLSGKFSDNYYHFIYETLVRSVYLKNNTIPTSIPLLVDEASMKIPSIRTMLELVSRQQNRELFTITAQKNYLIKKLYTIDNVNILAPHYKDNHEPVNAIGYWYDPFAIKELRNILLTIKSNKLLPKKVLLSRKNTHRRNYNEKELFDNLKNLGFVSIAPEEFPLEDQIALFNSADWIIGGSGAAFANLIFLAPNCNVICISPMVNNEIPPIFNTIAYINNAKLWYFFPTEQKKDIGVHSNYIIDAKKLGDIVSSIINRNSYES